MKKLAKLREKRILHKWFGWIVVVLALLGMFGQFTSEGWTFSLNVYNLAILLLGILSVIDSKKV